jgi:hypothetical protein
MSPLSRKAKIVLVIAVAVVVLAIAGVGFAVWYLRANPTPSPSGSTANYDATSGTWSGSFKIAMTPAAAGAYKIFDWTTSNSNPDSMPQIFMAYDQTAYDAATALSGVTPGDTLVETNNVTCINSQPTVPASFSTFTLDASSPCVVLGYLP